MQPECSQVHGPEILNGDHPRKRSNGLLAVRFYNLENGARNWYETRGREDRLRTLLSRPRTSIKCNLITVKPDQNYVQYCRLDTSRKIRFTTRTSGQTISTRQSCPTKITVGQANGVVEWKNVSHLRDFQHVVVTKPPCDGLSSRTSEQNHCWLGRCIFQPRGCFVELTIILSIRTTPWTRQLFANEENFILQLTTKTGEYT